MIKDLVKITAKEIEASAKLSIEDNRTLIMYLQNTGTQEHIWNNADISSWINEDLDD